MRIDWIEIRQFRSIGKKGIHLELKSGDRTRNPAILVGQNNAGKSNILSAIQFIATVMTMTRETPQTEFDWHLADRKNAINIKAQVDLSDESIDRIFRVLTEKASDLFEEQIADQLKSELTNKLLVEVLIEEEGKNVDFVSFRWGPLCFNLDGRIGLDNSWKGLTSFTQRNERETFELYLSMIRDPSDREPTKFKRALEHTLKSEKSFLNNYRLAAEIRGLFAAQIVGFSKVRNFPKGEKSSRSDSEDGSDLDSILINLMTSPNQEDRNKYDRIESSFRSIFPTLRIYPARDRETDRPQLSIRREDEQVLPIRCMGTGTLEILYLLSKLALAEDKVILIEDPELHLHPSAQQEIRDYLIETSKKNQIILTTHSGIFIDLENIDNNFLVQLRNGKTEVFYAKSSFSENFKSSISFFMSMEKRNIFFSKVVVFVEGKTELGALPVFARSKKIDFNSKSIFLFSLDGKKNLEKAIRIVDEFNIPWISICDYDAGMEITDSIDSKRVPLLFKQLDALGKLSREHMDFLEKNQDKTFARGGQQFFSEELFKEVKEILKGYQCFLLSSNFEGIFRLKEDKRLFKEARKVMGRSKPRQGKHVAEKMVENAKIPAEISSIIEHIESLCETP
ncbi:MAG: AAA family ATPase [Candidatus Methanofastidiosia archaeon]